ncbi:bestrophin family ion channel [Mucilaginibacter sp. PAMB04274]|uniref:bestrophin family protein n=1 Tax=Mucilaginibacter sp. PAMB04274 TaxID=3138568 RepID=UPI0031F6A48B
MLLNKKISIGYFISLIKYDLIAIASYAILAGSFDHYWIFAKINIPLAISAFVGTVLSLLLAFRTSQSYERWWEARTVWGAIVNDSRTLVRQVQQFLPDDHVGAAYVKKIAEQQIVWCHALSQSLRKLPWSGLVKDHVDQLHTTTTNLPNHLLSEHSRLLAKVSKEFSIDPNKQVQIDMTIMRLCDSMGKCERIKNTVFPRSYSVLLHFIIYVLMSLLPFGLEDNSKLVEVLLTFVIPALFISIEKTAHLMQDPFENRPTDTPTTALSLTIERNLREMSLMDGEIADNDQKGTYYLL